MGTSASCPVCAATTKVKVRDFSPAAWSMLMSWGEVDEPNCQTPMCEDCYWDLREVMIDRSAEIDQLVLDPVATVALQANVQTIAI